LLFISPKFCKIGVVLIYNVRINFFKPFSAAVVSIHRSQEIAVYGYVAKSTELDKSWYLRKTSQLGFEQTHQQGNG
jgi:hypothetical protein